MRTARPLAVLAIAAAALAVAACGGSSGAPAGDVLACQHFVQQGQKLKSEAAPSLADLALTAGWVATDAQLAVSPALKTAFTQDSKAISDLLGSFSDTTAQQDAITKRGDDAAAQVKSICGRDGVTTPLPPSVLRAFPVFCLDLVPGHPLGELGG